MQYLITVDNDLFLVISNRKCFMIVHQEISNVAKNTKNFWLQKNNIYNALLIQPVFEYCDAVSRNLNKGVASKITKWDRTYNYLSN